MFNIMNQSGKYFYPPNSKNFAENGLAENNPQEIAITLPRSRFEKSDAEV